MSAITSAAQPKINPSRAWCFTLNNYTPLQHAALLDFPFASYVIIGEELSPTNQTPHLQGYIYIPSKKSLRQMKAVCPEAHWEVAKGSPESNKAYCSKDGRFQERGTPPASAAEKGAKGQAARAKKIQEMWDLAKSGKIEGILPPGQVKTWEYINMKYGSKAVDRTELVNYWIVGKSGCGKSRLVRETFPSFYSKPMSRWWDGYAREDVVVLDDFAPEHGKYLGYYLKIWADHYSFNAEVKCGMLHIRPRIVIVTSQYPIQRCFEEAETIEAVLRRFQVVNMGPGLAAPLLPAYAPGFDPGPQRAPVLHVPIVASPSVPAPPRLVRTDSVSLQLSVRGTPSVDASGDQEPDGETLCSSQESNISELSCSQPSRLPRSDSSFAGHSGPRRILSRPKPASPTSQRSDTRNSSALELGKGRPGGGGGGTGAERGPLRIYTSDDDDC